LDFSVRTLMSSPFSSALFFTAILLLVMNYVDLPTKVQDHAVTEILDFRDKLSTVLCSWAGKHQHKFPENQQELDFAVKEFFHHDVPCPYRQTTESEVLAYDLKFIANAQGSYLAPRGRDRAATVFCAVDRDFEHYWVSIITLDGLYGWGGECREVDFNESSSCNHYDRSQDDME